MITQSRLKNPTDPPPFRVRLPMLMGFWVSQTRP